MFVNQRVPLKRWEEDLARISPKDGVQPWLQLVWMAGDTWDPVQRWVIYEMMPMLDWLPEYLREALDGPSPRDPKNGRWVHDIKGKRWESTSPVSLLQWRLYHEHKAYPVLFWIIQGEKGGNKWLFTPGESKILRMRGLPHVPPYPGELEYAPFDNRVTAQLDRYLSLKRRDQELLIQRRSPNVKSAILLLNRRRSEAEETWRTKLSDWLADQVAPLADELDFALRKVTDVHGLPLGDRHYNKDEDEVEETFVKGEPINA